MESWESRALCRRFGLLWFTHLCNSTCLKSHGKRCADDPAVVATEAVCHVCPVEAECRVWACLLPLAEGVAGGMTRAQRIQVRRKIRRSKEYSYLVSNQE